MSPGPALAVCLSPQRHQNPCFLRSAGGSTLSPLARDQWVELHHGDHIALLPDSLVFRVEHRQGTEARVTEVGVTEVGVTEVGVAEVGVAEVGVTEVGVTEVGVTEVGVTEVGVTEVGVTEVGVTEVGVTGPNGSHKETTVTAREKSSPAASPSPEPPPAPVPEEVREKEREEPATIAANTGRKRALPAWLSAVKVEPRPTEKKAAARKPAVREPVVREQVAAGASKKAPSKPVRKAIKRKADSPLPPPDDSRGRVKGMWSVKMYGVGYMVGV